MTEHCQSLNVRAGKVHDVVSNKGMGTFEASTQGTNAHARKFGVQNMLDNIRLNSLFL